MRNPLIYRASNPDGRKAQIRQSEDPYDTVYSVFTWRDTPASGVYAWREEHELTYAAAYKIAADWLVG